MVRTEQKTDFQASSLVTFSSSNSQVFSRIVFVLAFLCLSVGKAGASDPACDECRHCHITLAESYLKTARGKQVCVAPQDQVWWITSRNVKCGLDSLEQLPTLQYQHNGAGSGNWQISHAGEFCAEQAGNSEPLTIFYIHGNRTDPKWSLNRGIQVYENLFGKCLQRRPVRFVIWHWPADQSKFPVKEFESNSRRAIAHGRYFAKFMHYLDPSNDIGLIGYSLGSQFLLSASEQTTLYADSGCGNSGDWIAANINLAVFASVTQCQWPTCRARLARASHSLDSVLNFQNHKDKALRFFRAKCRLENGLQFYPEKTIGCLEKYGSSVSCVEISKLVGREHSIVKYSKPSIVQCRIRDHFGLNGVEN